MAHSKNRSGEFSSAGLWDSESVQERYELGACGFVLGVHEDLVPAVELDGRVVGVTHAAALHDQHRDEEAVRVLLKTLSNAPTYGPAKRLLAAIKKV